jgi:hypothetical protein
MILFLSTPQYLGLKQGGAPPVVHVPEIKVDKTTQDKN